MCTSDCLKFHEESHQGHPMGNKKASVTQVNTEGHKHLTWTGLLGTLNNDHCVRNVNGHIIESRDYEMIGTDFAKTLQ